MKKTLSLLLALVPFMSFAQSFLCSSDQLGVIQLELNQTSESRICQFQKNNQGQWDKMKSGIGHFTKSYFDQQKNEYRQGYSFTTLRNSITVSIPEDKTDEVKISIYSTMDSSFGPMINTGYANQTSAICYQRNDIAPCQADRFLEPKDMPKNEQAMKKCVEDSERDFWGKAPTFTLVSPDQNDFIVVTAMTKKAMRSCSFGTISASNELITSTYVLPKLQNGWKVLDVYSNFSGMQLAKQLSERL